MPTLSRDQIADAYRRLGIRPISGGDQSNDAAPEGDPKAGETNTDDAKPEAKPDEPLGDAGKAALDKERDARKAAEKERDALRKEKADADAAKAKEQEEAAAKRGEFEALATKREGERDKAREEAAALTAQLDQYRAAVEATVADQWKALPKEVAEVYPGAEDDPLAKLAFLAKSKGLVEKLTAGGAPRGNGRDPKSTGAAGVEIKSLIPKAAFLG